MNKIKDITDEKIVKKWKRYCKRIGIHCEEPSLPLKRKDGCVILENEGRDFATFVADSTHCGFIINEAWAMTIEERLEKIAFLLDDAEDKLESLAIDLEESKNDSNVPDHVQSALLFVSHALMELR